MNVVIFNSPSYINWDHFTFCPHFLVIPKRSPNTLSPTLENTIVPIPVLGLIKT